LLLAVEPDRFCGVDSVVPGREIGGLISADRLETTVDAILLRVADVTKGRLGYGVVLLLEREPDGVADFSVQSLWLEQEGIRSSATDSNFMHRGRSDRDERKGGERCEKHYEGDVRGELVVVVGAAGSWLRPCLKKMDERWAERK
jgi:hypothetical protein